MAAILNYTPHAIHIMDESHAIQQVFPSDGVARIGSKRERVDDLNGIMVHETTFGDVYGLPEEIPGIYIIVSALVRAALPERKDLISPDTSPNGVVRCSKTNTVIGVRGFQR